MARPDKTKRELREADRRTEQRAWYAKLAICVLIDLADFTVGRIPGIGIPADLLSTIAAVGLFGWPGLAALWELADPTHQVGGFVPTLTLLAWSQRPKPSARAK